MLELVDEGFQFLAIRTAGGNAVRLNPLAEGFARAVPLVRMPPEPREGPSGSRQRPVGTQSREEGAGPPKN